MLAANLVTIPTEKIKLIPDLYTWANVLIKQQEEIDENSFSSSNGGQNSPLMHVGKSLPGPE